MSQLRKFTKGGMRVPSWSEVLVVRGVDDEAGLALAAGSISQRMSRVILQCYLGVSLVGGLLFGIIGILALLLPHFVWSALRETELGIALALLIFIPLCVIGIGGACRSVYGRELFFGSFRCDISSHSAPDGAMKVDIKTLHPRYDFAQSMPLRHSVYENPSCPEAIAKWIYSQRTMSVQRERL